MKPGLFLCLVLVLSGCPTAIAQYSMPLTIPTANPSIREEYQVHVPTKLLVKRTQGILMIYGDRDSLEYTNLMVGTNMLLAMWCDVYVYSAGSSRPTNYCHNVEKSDLCPNASIADKLDFNPGPYLWRPEGKGIAEPPASSAPWIHTHKGGVVSGAKYNIEMELTIFETDAARIYRTWNPAKARYYKILWQRTLKQTFE